jgi:hypothetical protein
MGTVISTGVADPLLQETQPHVALPMVLLGEAVAYDAARQQVVLFGGAPGLQARWGDDRYLGDTWIWERAWTVPVRHSASPLRLWGDDTAPMTLVDTGPTAVPAQLSRRVPTVYLSSAATTGASPAGRIRNGEGVETIGP